MPDERDIEKTLQAYAKHRRDQGGTPPELHPATRKLLQDEVARQYGGAKSESRFWAWALWGTPSRMAASLSLVVLAVAGLLVLPQLWRDAGPSAPELRLAKNDQTQELKQATVNGTSRLQDKLSDNKSPGGGNPSEREGAASLPPESSPANSPYVLSAPAASPPAPLLAAQAESAAAAPVLAAAPAPPSNFGLAGSTLASQATPAAPAVTQQFFRAPVTAAAAPQISDSPPPPVLNSFRVERRGNDLRVIDSDGSVYSGVLTLISNTATASGPIGGTVADSSGATSAPGAGDTNSPPAAAPNPRRGGAGLAAQNYSFTVSGTNLSLNQLVVFSGNLIPNNARGGRGGRGGAGGGGRRLGGGGGGGFGGSGGGAGQGVQTYSTNNAADAGLARGPSPAQPVNFRLQGTKIVIGTNELYLNDPVPANLPPGTR